MSVLLQSVAANLQFAGVTQAGTSTACRRIVALSGHSNTTVTSLRARLLPCLYLPAGQYERVPAVCGVGYSREFATESQGA
jgi:hypothetical protein